MKKFSHVDNFTDYMDIIFEHVKDLSTGADGAARQLQILDIPAGNGLLADRLSTLGHEVVCADINDERPSYVRANMEERLPFEDNTFDIAICMEGIEHVINQSLLLSELVRVTKPKGKICISTPNISNIWSRLTFLFTGYFYQFTPSNSKIPLPGECIDKGHISPITIYDLGYSMGFNGAGLSLATGDRCKKKLISLFVLIFIFPFAYMNAKKIHKNLPQNLFEHKASKLTYFNFKVLTSRSLIAIFSKR